MTVSVAVMAVRRRAHFVDQLLDRLGADGDRVVWDRKQDRCDTGLRAMQAYDPSATHHLVIQDDALVCNDLLPGLERLVQHSAEHPVSLYVGRTRPHPLRVHERFNAARAAGSSLLEMRGPLWGVGIVYPVKHLDELCDWYATDDHPNYDMRVSRWYMARKGLDCLYTIPSLVDHRPVAENPSTVEGRTGNRQAHWFVGEDASALDVRWNSQRTVEDAAGIYATFYNRANGSFTRARSASSSARRMRAENRWEEVTTRSASA